MEIKIVAYPDGFHKELTHFGKVIARCDVLDDTFIKCSIEAYQDGISESYKQGLIDGTKLINTIEG